MSTKRTRAEKKKLFMQIMAWVLAVLMAGGAATLAISLLIPMF